MNGEEADPSGLTPRFLAVDFFCGAGGTTRGLIDAGGYVIAGVDKEPRCRRTYVENNSNRTLDAAEPGYLEYDIFPSTELYPAGQQAALIEKLDTLIAQYRAAARSAPLLFAICAPCQPFTTLARKELSDARKKRRERDSNLLIEAAVFVERHRPEMVLSENVAGIGDPRYGGIWDDFQAKLKALGYTTGTRRICTSGFGIPQYRKRSILLAIRSELVREEALSTLVEDALHVPEVDQSASPVSVQEAIMHFPALGAGENDPTVPNHRTRSLSPLNLKRLAAAKPGESNLYLETTEHGDLSLECHRRVNARLDDRCFTDVYTRMRPNRPSPTITTRCHSISNGRFGHYDTAQIRGISLREAAALQSFGDDYVFHPTEMIEPVARMIGNAVPPKLARFFAEHLASSVKPISGSRPATP
ncbi:DNA cytosine methyltransferase [Mesorhizobium sp. M0684]|uniref:DNA cytosine methyltransferase n=1 Tax=unclassified Mesorhizobium TaxID=325217 RepID=UPI0033361298